MSHSISTMTGKTKVKIVLLGGQAVGKSSIIEKYIHDRFDESANPTVGIDFLAKNVSHGSKNYRLQLWDTAGQERFRSLIPSYLKDANCALVVFDLASPHSLAQTDMWASLFAENKASEGFLFLVGNKLDLPRQISPEEAALKATELGLPYFEISAKTGQNVDELFMTLIEQCAQRKTAATTLVSKEKGQEMKREVSKNQEARVNADETALKLATQSEGKGEGVVLKNQKVGKAEGTRGCC